MINYSQRHTSHYLYPSVMSPMDLYNYVKNLNNKLDWDFTHFHGTHQFVLQRIDMNKLQYKIIKDTNNIVSVQIVPIDFLIMYSTANKLDKFSSQVMLDLDKTRIKKYALMDSATSLPIVTIFNHIIDGYHRILALKENNQPVVFSYVLKSKLEYGEYV